MNKVKNLKNMSLKFENPKVFFAFDPKTWVLMQFFFVLCELASATIDMIYIYLHYEIKEYKFPTLTIIYMLHLIDTKG